ncbi:hypothetical protein E4T39_05246 [Aureobasidium subglaciale]|nr:hypothetical protein E4T39_05246 [Aureobasidium subglaciale]
MPHDERSDPLSGDDEVLPPKRPAPKKSAAKTSSEPAEEEEVDEEMLDVKNGHVGADNNDEDEDDEEDNADEYVVEKILKHAFDNGKDCLYEVKWLGYENVEDRTWEPEENLEGAMDVLQAYWDSIGGKPQAKPKTPAKKGTKRKSAPAQDTPEVASSSTTKKRGRKSIKTAEEQPEDAKLSSFPEGSWEDHVQLIDAVEQAGEGDSKGDLVVYLLWENGKQTQHPAKLLDYYESKLFVDHSKPKTRRRRSTNKV